MSHSSETHQLCIPLITYLTSHKFYFTQKFSQLCQPWDQIQLSKSWTFPRSKISDFKEKLICTSSKYSKHWKIWLSASFIFPFKVSPIQNRFIQQAKGKLNLIAWKVSQDFKVRLRYDICFQEDDGAVMLWYINLPWNSQQIIQKSFIIFRFCSFSSGVLREGKYRSSSSVSSSSQDEELFLHFPHNIYTSQSSN